MSRCGARAAVLAIAAGLAASAPAGAGGPAGGRAAALVAAYPDQLSRIDGKDLVWRNGVRMPVSDGVAGKSFEQMLDGPDIDDMFALPYRAGPARGPPAVDEDPGRIRYEPLFLGMYGDCFKGEVKPRLRRVAWIGGQSVAFTTVNGADKALEAVAKDLASLPTAMRRYLTPSAGTYNCRTIAGTRRRSMHAYGAAIDINTRYSDYWMWAKPTGEAIPYKNRIPYDIARVFERHGFIWGAKWYHYDTMHFEYRPELLGLRAAR